MNKLPKTLEVKLHEKHGMVPSDIKGSAHKLEGLQPVISGDTFCRGYRACYADMQPLVEALEKAIPKKEPELKSPVLQGLQKESTKAYKKMTEKLQKPF